MFLKRSKRLLLLLVKLVLTAPVLFLQASQSMPLGTLARESASVAHRLQRFHSGSWIELISEAKHSWPLARPPSLRENVAETDEISRKFMDRALSLVAQGEISRAVHLLQSRSIAEANNATADLLRPILCPNPSQPAPCRSRIQKRQDAAASISSRHFLRTLRKAAKGGACDLTGWHYEKLQLSLGKKIHILGGPPGL